LTGGGGLGQTDVSDPAVRSLHAEWEHDARTAVAAVRMEAAKDPDDPELAVLVGELAVQDPDFRTWWATHQVAGTHYGTKHYRHPVVGDLTLDCDTWNSPDGTGQRLMILTAEPGTPSHDGLPILASWAAQTQPSSRAPSGTHVPAAPVAGRRRAGGWREPMAAPL
jgi:MmyB-like transcription regulator ligand binding domain